MALSKSTADTDSSKITWSRSCTGTNGSRKSTRARLRSRDWSSRVRSSVDDSLRTNGSAPHECPNGLCLRSASSSGDDDPGSVYGGSPGTGAGPLLPSGVRCDRRRTETGLRRPGPDRLLCRGRWPTVRYGCLVMVGWRGEGPSRHKGEGRDPPSPGPPSTGRARPRNHRLGPAVRAHALSHLPAPPVRSRLENLCGPHGGEPAVYRPSARRLSAGQFHAGGSHSDRGRV